MGLRAHVTSNCWSNATNQRIALGLAMLAGAAFGGVAVNELSAQNKAPGAYAVIDISEISSPDVFKTLLPKTGPSMDAFGGKNVILTENIVGLDGSRPKRFVVIAFDSMDKAKAWDSSPAQKEITGIRTKSTKSRAFIADGTLN
jgi:uncharacterized protein (DUF1330 family)